MRAAAGTGVLLVGGLLAGCAYYNAMWNAERLDREARRFEAQGRLAEAKIGWAMAATKAESVVARHPRSRWVDDALLIQGRAHRALENCERAEPPLLTAERISPDDAVRLEARLLLGECRVVAGDLAAADSLLASVAPSEQRRLASRAWLWLGRIAAARGDLGRALELLGQSSERGALLERAWVWLALGDPDRAAAAAHAFARLSYREAEWLPLLDSLAAHGGGDAVVRLVTRFAADRDIGSGARARLLLAEGHRRRAAGDVPGAEARYREVVAAAGDSLEGSTARVALLRGALGRVEQIEALTSFRAALRTAAPSGGDPAAAAQQLARAVERVLQDPQDPVTAFVRAEVARDSLGAARLAAPLFLVVPERWPESLFAPKALLAAAALDSARRAELVAQAQARYPQSPYVLALAGDPGLTYTVAEDSLRVALGDGEGEGEADGRVVAATWLPRLGPRTVLEEENMPILEPAAVVGPPSGPARRGAPPPKPRQPARDRDRP